MLAVRLLSLAQIRVYFFVATELVQKEPFKIIYRQEDPRSRLLMDSLTVLLMLRKSSLYHCIVLNYSTLYCDRTTYWFKMSELSTARKKRGILLIRSLETATPGVGSTTTPTIPIVLLMLVSCATCTAKNFKRLSCLQDKHIGGL